MKPTLLVTVNPDVLVPDYSAAASGRKRFLNRRPNRATRTWELVSNEPIRVPVLQSYIKALRAGELLPADEYTKRFL